MASKAIGKNPGKYKQVGMYKIMMNLEALKTP